MMDRSPGELNARCRGPMYAAIAVVLSSGCASGISDGSKLPGLGASSGDSGSLSGPGPSASGSGSSDAGTTGSSTSGDDSSTSPGSMSPGSTSPGDTNSGTDGGATDTDAEGTSVAMPGDQTGGPADGGTTIPPGGSCLDGDTAYGADGPFQYTMTMMGSINFWVPTVPSGCKVPVIHLSNGTGATCSDYLPALERLATHGFLVACYEDPNTGAGTDALTALETALMAYPDLADMRFGSTGHSQGGQAAFTGLQLAEAKYGTSMIYAGLAMEPASGFGTQPTDGTWQMVYSEIKSPMFMFSGLVTDGLVAQSWVQEAYDATSATEEAYFWTCNGATHIPVPNSQEEEISVPWFRWKLLGDNAACKYFKAIPTMDTNWAQVASKNAEACQ